jgi:hypothetical protein
MWPGGDVLPGRLPAAESCTTCLLRGGAPHRRTDRGVAGQYFVVHMFNFSSLWWAPLHVLSEMAL